MAFFGRAHRGRTGEKLPFYCFKNYLQNEQLHCVKKGLRAEPNALRNPFSLLFCEYTAGRGDIADFGLPRRHRHFVRYAVL